MSRSDEPFDKVKQCYQAFPRALIEHLRQVTDATSDSDAFICYCNLLEWLTIYLNNLANSVYAARPADAIDEQLEQRLRSTTLPASFGTAVGGLRAFAASKIDLADHLPELAEVLTSRQLPVVCVRLTRAYKLITRARQDFAIPPGKLPRFVEEHLPPDKNLGGCNLDAFLSAIVPFRNKGIGHQAQAEETWFPRDQQMYALVGDFLRPAVDELLTWAPLRTLLLDYEVVDLESSPLRTIDGRRAAAISRKRIEGAMAPLGRSYLFLASDHRPPDASNIAFVARRLPALPDRLEAVIRYTHFPRTLQSSELLARRYGEIYLQAYLERGLITPTQRETRLRAKFQELAIAERERLRIESELQEAINVYASDDPAASKDSFQRLEATLGERWLALRERVEALLAELPKRRKDYIFEQIDNNVVMSFAQLRAESELSEPDLDTVLGELEAEEKVRQISGSGAESRQHSHFKAQDPSKPARLRNLLSELQAQGRRPRSGYPAPLWQLLRLCADLLADDGLALDEAELDRYRELFDLRALGDEPEDPAGDLMILNIEGQELRAASLSDLFTGVMEALTTRGVDPSPALPLLLGKTRYLVARSPVHANGTPFANPIDTHGIYFEGNLKRVQALAELIRMLGRLNLEASSPAIEQPRRDSDGGEFGDHDDLTDIGGLDDLEELGSEEDETEDDDAGDAMRGPRTRLAIDVFPAGQEEPTSIQGATVRRFFTNLLDFFLKHEAPIAEIVPVATGRVRYLLSEEPYHRNGRLFDSVIERGGYFMNAAYTYDQALSAAETLCAKAGWRSSLHGRPSPTFASDSAPLQLQIGELLVEADDVPNFLHRALETLFDQELLRVDELPYKAGRVRYLIAEKPIHDHGRQFIRPTEIEIGDHRYYIECNISRQGAVDLIQRLLASKQVDAAAVV